MRILQVGAGRWGRNHVRSWERLGVELSVCDSDPEALAELAVPTCADASAALDTVDAIDVVTPADTHPALVREALERGKDVFVEKPFTPEPAEAFALQALAKERGRIVQVGHVFRFAPVAQAVKQAIDAGRIGEPRYLQGHFMGFKRPRTDGGAAISDGIHWVDLASWLLGRQPELATATLRDSLGRGMDDIALLTLDYGGALAQLEAGYFPPEPRRDAIVMGSEGAIVCDFLAKDEPVRLYGGAHRQEADGRWTAVEGEREVLAVGDGEPLLDELRAFVAACNSRTPSAIASDGHDGAAAVAVIEACQRSAREGRRVEVKLPTPR